MAVTKKELLAQSADAIYTMVQENVSDAVSMQTVLGSTAKVFAVQIDNTNNATDNCWLKIWTSATAVIGTDTPTVILMADAAKKVQYTFDTGFAIPQVHAAVLASNGTSGNAGPEGTVTVRFMLEV
jgi:hypothetical protein